MNNFIRLHVDGYGAYELNGQRYIDWIGIEVSNGPFSGYTDAFLSGEEIARFAAGIIAYPLAEEPIKLRSLIIESNGTEQCLASLILRADPYRAVRIDVRLEVLPAINSDVTHVCQTVIFADYEPIRRFSQALMGILRGDLDEAILVANEYKG